MATRLGARALHMEHLTGSLEPGKRADLVVVDLDTTHNLPSFDRDPAAIYARLVYAAKSADVSDVMCNGRWLMRDRRLLTLDEPALARDAREVARRIDTFLTGRELSILQKLVAVGGAVEQESFEVQVKARLASKEDARRVLTGPDVTIVRRSRYHQFDTYWSFEDVNQGWLRYREDEFLDDTGAVTGARARLTLTGATREDQFGSVLLSRSRYLAPALHSARFYREYFRPTRQHIVEKVRERWLIAYRGVEFYVHVDELVKPQRDGWFLEVKSRTWSRRDAQDKAATITELLSMFGATPDAGISDGYVDLAASNRTQ
jgi:5-methylthioadenosine/S-adenosylhomocysteine deaminase